MDHPYKITSDLKIIQHEMKLAIQTHQAMRIKFEGEPDNMGLLKDIAGTEKSIQTLGRKQNLLVKCLRRYLSSCSSDYALIRQLITKSLASSWNGIVNKTRSMPVSETCYTAKSLLNGVVAKGNGPYAVKNNVRGKCPKFNGTCKLNNSHILEDSEYNRESESSVASEFEECQSRFHSTNVEIKENSLESCRITNNLGRNIQEMSEATWRTDTQRIEGTNANTCPRKHLSAKEDVSIVKLRASGDIPKVKCFTAFGICSENVSEKSSGASPASSKANTQELKADSCANEDTPTRVLPENNSIAVKQSEKDKNYLYLQDESDAHIIMIKELYTHKMKRNSNKGVTPQHTYAEKQDFCNMFRDGRSIQYIKNELLSEIQLPAKVCYLSGLGLVTKEALSELQNRRVERKRRSTANHTQFVYGSSWDISTKKRKKNNYLASNVPPTVTRQATRSQVRLESGMKKPVSMASSESTSAAVDPMAASPPIHNTRSATPTCQSARSTCPSIGKSQIPRNVQCKTPQSQTSQLQSSQGMEVPRSTQSSQAVPKWEHCTISSVPEMLTSQNSKDIQTSPPFRNGANSHIKSTHTVVHPMDIPQVVFTPRVVQTCSPHIVQRNSSQVVRTSRVAQIAQFPPSSIYSPQSSALDKSAQGRDSTAVRAFPTSLVVPVPQQALFVQPARFPLFVQHPQILVQAPLGHQTMEASTLSSGGNVKPSQGSSLQGNESSRPLEIVTAFKAIHDSHAENISFSHDQSSKISSDNCKGPSTQCLVNNNDLLLNGAKPPEDKITDRLEPSANSVFSTKKPLCAECQVTGFLSFCHSCNISIHEGCLEESGICKKCKQAESNTYVNNSQKETKEVAKSTPRSKDMQMETKVKNITCDRTEKDTGGDMKCSKVKSTGNQKSNKSNNKSKKASANKGHKSTGGSKGKQNKGNASVKKPSGDKRSHESQASSPVPHVFSQDKTIAIIQERLQEKKRLEEENCLLNDDLKTLRSRVDDLNISLANQETHKKDVLSMEDAVRKKIQFIHDFISMVKNPHPLSTS